ncbi:MAG: hypothetical protein HQK92_09030 [Nitrospirae bacterium]|nr:hypothetical protein [Nitrospirota bacterium]
MRFTLKETTELIKNTVKHTFEKDTIEDIYNNTDGLVAALILTIEQIKKNPAQYTGAVTQGLLFDFFSGKVFEAADSDVQEFLLKTAYFPEFTAEMAIALTGYTLTQKLLRRDRGEYFLTATHSNNAVTFRYHALYREFLLRQAQVYYRQQVREITLSAADVLEESGYIEHSIQLLIEIKHWDRLQRLLLKSVQGLIADGRYNIIDAWFLALPDEFLQEQPWLLYWSGINKFSLNLEDARKILEAVYLLFKKLKESEGQILSLCAVIKALVMEWRNFHPLDHWIKEFEEELIEVYRSTDAVEIKEEVVASIVTALIFRQPNHKDIDYWLQEADNIVLHSKNAEIRMYIGYNLTLYYLWTGSVYKAGNTIETLHHVYRNTQKHLLLRLMCMRCECMCTLYKASYKDTLKVVEEGLKIADETGLHLTDTMFLGLGIYCFLALGNNEMAEVYMQKIISYMGDIQIYGFYYYQMASLIAYAKGNFSTAIEYGEKNIEYTEQYGCQLMQGVHLSILICLLAEAGYNDKALLYLEHLKRIGLTARSLLFTYFSLEIEALISVNNNDLQRFEVKIEEFVRIAKVTGMKGMLPFRKHVHILCKTALERGIQTDYIKEIIRLHNLTPGGDMIDDWPYPVRIYTFGRFKIEKDGRILESRGKMQQKPLALLKELALSEEEGVSAEKISEFLWPDSDSEAAKTSFNTTLHRTRKMLDSEDNNFILYHDGKVSLNREFVWTDVWAFNYLSERVEELYKNRTVNSAASDDDFKEVLALLLKIHDLLRGCFVLPNDGHLLHHAPSVKQRIRGSISKLVRCVTKWCQDTGELEKADKIKQLFQMITEPQDIEIDGLTL